MKNIVAIYFYRTLNLEYNELGQIKKEDHNGAITLWEYNTHGFPVLQTQVTGTEDPNVVTTYDYNKQGQCIEKITSDAIQQADYDLMGNRFQSLVYAKSGALLSATYNGHNLNNQPIWETKANPKNILYLDYNASGKAQSFQTNALPHPSNRLYTL